MRVGSKVFEGTGKLMWRLREKIKADRDEVHNVEEDIAKMTKETEQAAKE